MFLALDVGNTHTVLGVLDEEKLFFSCRFSTDRNKTSDEYSVMIRELLIMHHTPPEQISGGIISSVVPSMKAVLRDAVYSVTGRTCMIVGPGVKNGLKIRIDNPAQLGSDQVADAVAAIAEYPKPLLVFDMGTATTVSVINENTEYIGGMIMAGALLGLDALSNRTSQLPEISFADKVDRLIGSNTVDCMRSGFAFGTAAMIDGVIDRMQKQFDRKLTVVLTGKTAEMITPYCEREVVLDKNLLLKGLRIIYLKNLHHKGSR